MAQLFSVITAEMLFMQMVYGLLLVPAEIASRVQQMELTGRDMELLFLLLGHIVSLMAMDCGLRLVLRMVVLAETPLQQVLMELIGLVVALLYLLTMVGT